MTKVSKPVWMYQGQAQLLRSKSPMKSSIDTTPNTFVLNFNHIEKNHPHRNRMETWSPEQTSDREVRGWSSYLEKRNENISKKKTFRKWKKKIENYVFSLLPRVRPPSCCNQCIGTRLWSVFWNPSVLHLIGWGPGLSLPWNERKSLWK